MRIRHLTPCRTAALLAALCTVPVLVLGPGAPEASAHGSNQGPMSRNWYCVSGAGGSIWNPDSINDPACRAAARASNDLTAYGTWQQLAQGNVAGKHRSMIPDGKLVGANVKGFEGMDLARGDWKAIDLSAIRKNGGDFEFVWQATASHTGHISYYITKDGVDTTKPLKWSDLEPTPFLVGYTHAGRTTSGGTDGMSATYRHATRLPEGKTGRHVIYAIWQRQLPAAHDASPNHRLEEEIFGSNNSDESFYATLDVTL
ncbi:lytic polysaccharide monooxygenase [Streptoverticillium reticulum]|uniref:lytic polysaccharide monooxygenase n=1 Tax=Streptoverticillium reticulum TaxID=1433415 RepID=UPI0039BFA295